MVATLENLDADRIQWYIDNGLVHEIHTSERRSFRGCRRRWDWLYREQFYPNVTAKPLEFGVAYHKAMEIYYNPETWSFPNDVKVQMALQGFVDECEKQRAKALATVGSLMPEVEADYNDRVELGRGMITYYFASIAPKEDLNWTPVKVEVEFIIPIPNPETGAEIIWCRCSKCKEKYAKFSGTHVDDDMHGDAWWGLPVMYSGRIDMLAKDNDGNYWIFDWKTAANINLDKEYLLLDDQIGTYVWALRKIGINVVGFIYHEQLKGYPKPPEKLNRITKGRMYSVSKTQTTDYDTFLKTVSRNDIEGWGADAYEDFLTYLKHDGIVFYDRKQIYKTDAECKATEINVGLEALDMTDPNLRMYPSSGKFACNSCAYKQPCIEKNAGNDYQYALDTMFTRKIHYYEEARMTTDKR